MSALASPESAGYAEDVLFERWQQTLADRRDSPAVTDAGTAPATDATAGAELAVSEQADFDRAKEVLGQGDFQGAAALFATYAQSYPGGPLIPEAHYLRGEALSKQGDTANAARAYLDAFSAAPEGPLAGDALLKLGEGQLYPILHRLEEDGLVLGDWEMQEGKPPRKVYKLSDSGLAALTERRREWSSFSKAVGNVLGANPMKEATNRA